MVPKLKFTRLDFGASLLMKTLRFFEKIYNCVFGEATLGKKLDLFEKDLKFFSTRTKCTLYHLFCTLFNYKKKTRVDPGKV